LEQVDNLEEEQCDPYKSTICRLGAAGVDVNSFFLNIGEKAWDFYHIVR